MITAKIATSLIVALLAYATFQLTSGRTEAITPAPTPECLVYECAAHVTPPSSNLFL
jgi:hypothetical protein